MDSINPIFTYKDSGESKHAYLERLRERFYEKLDGLIYKGKPVEWYGSPEKESDLFHHVVTQAVKGKERVYDYKRAQTALTLPEVIRRVDEEDCIIIFSDGTKEILYLLDGDNDYIVVLEDHKSSYMVLTGYRVNQPNTTRHFYKQKIIPIDSIRYSHSLSLTRVNRVPSELKEIYVDDDIMGWLRHNYDNALVYRIVAHAIAHSENLVYFLSPKNAQQKFGESIDKNVIELSRLENNISEDDEILLNMIEKSLDIIETIESDNTLDNDRAFIKKCNVINTFFRDVTHESEIKRVIEVLLKEYGYRIPRLMDFKFETQFPDIIKAIRLTDLKKKNQILKQYKIDSIKCAQSTCLSDYKSQRFHERYFIKVLTLFKDTLVGGDSLEVEN